MTPIALRDHKRIQLYLDIIVKHKITGARWVRVRDKLSAVVDDNEEDAGKESDGNGDDSDNHDNYEVEHDALRTPASLTLSFLLCCESNPRTLYRPKYLTTVSATASIYQEVVIRER